MLSNEELLAAIPNVIESVSISGWGEKEEGKVRDIYRGNGRRLLITTDRVSAFDRVLGLIPYKGQILNQLSAWWFEQTADIVNNHIISIPDPNVAIVQEAESLPVEIIVRGYITGVTTTSLWYLYEQGDRAPYGIPMPDGLVKNDALPTPIITPTTKAERGQHDEKLTREEILERGLVSPELWEKVETAALALFARGQELAARAGLILVDTKYEMGLVNGELTIIDEIHTPDSSRYWIADSYQPGGEPPQNFDKEFLREWFAAQGYRGEGPPPTMPDEFIAQVAARYIGAYERLTGKVFVPGEQPVEERVARNLI